MNCKRLAECDRVEFGDQKAWRANLRRAAEDLRRAMESGRKDLSREVAIQLAHTKILLGDDEEALELLDHIIDGRGVRLADAYFLRGFVRQKWGRHELASTMADYNRALGIDENHVDARMALASLLSSLGQHEGAAPHYRKLSLLRPESRAIARLLAREANLARD